MIQQDIAAYQARAVEVFEQYSPGKDPRGAIAVWRMCRAAQLAEKVLDLEVHRPRNRSWSTFRVLWALYLMGAIDPGTLARLLDVAPPSISSLLATLENAEMITRAPDPKNRRRVVVNITPKGVEAAEDAVIAQTASQEKFVASLDPGEQLELGRLLGKLLDYQWEKQGHELSL